MSVPMLRVVDLGKQYPLDAPAAGYVTFRERVWDGVCTPWRRFRRLAGSSRPTERFWALRHVSFDVAPGEVVGIIGRNGAGKSTLLKILSRITEPSAGRAELRGRVASLLEVGTGFHPELTGRENIYLNGSLLGMSRSEISRKFQHIVAFAETGAFLNTPVKRYSSGMYMRLAFAIAAYLDSELLLIDEVLAVGDVSFQKKCLHRMHQLGRQGRTVLFVSHNLAAVNRLCPRTILLAGGRLAEDGPSPHVVASYLRASRPGAPTCYWPGSAEAPGNEIVRLTGVCVRTSGGVLADSFDIRRPIGIEMQFQVLQAGHVLVPNFHLTNQEGICVFVTCEVESAWHRRPRPAGHFTSTAWIPGNTLSEGTMLVDAAISTMTPLRVHVHERQVVAFNVHDSLESGSARGDYGGEMPGVVRPLLKWTTQYRGQTPGRKVREMKSHTLR